MIVFLSTAASDKFIRECADRFSKRKTVFVQQRWDYSLAKAFNRLDASVCFISYPPIRVFPEGKGIRFKRTEDHSGELSVAYCGFVNLPYLKRITQVKNIIGIIRKELIKRKENELTVITHCFYPQSFDVVRKLKKKYGVKVFAIIPDLPEFSYPVYSRNKLFNLIWKRDNKKKQKYKKIPDGYICFSEHQMRYLDNRINHIVMEGFADFEKIEAIGPVDLHTEKKIFIYAGALKEAYGVNNLIDAFEKAFFPDAELWLYGVGDSVRYLEERKPKKVFYKGCVDWETMVALEKSAFALVNPRPVTDEYSNCSFPSKLLEYMSSGTPVLTTRLLSIPEEYEDKLFFMNDSSVDEILKSLTAFYELEDEEKKKVSRRALEFVRAEKNSLAQAKRILEFVKGEEG